MFRSSPPTRAFFALAAGGHCKLPAGEVSLLLLLFSTENVEESRKESVPHTPLLDIHLHHFHHLLALSLPSLMLVPESFAHPIPIIFHLYIPLQSIFASMIFP